MRRIVYIASPYTKGDQAENVAAQMKAASELIHWGFAPYWPLCSHFLHMFHPQKYGTWMDIDMGFLRLADILLRIPGESHGADLEISRAIELKIPIYYDVISLVSNEFANK